MKANETTALDAAMTPLFHMAHTRRRASEWIRSAEQ